MGLRVAPREGGSGFNCPGQSVSTSVDDCAGQRVWERLRGAIKNASRDSLSDSVHYRVPFRAGLHEALFRAIPRDCRVLIRAHE